MTDLLGGQTQYTIDGLTGLYLLIRDGKLRALAMARGEHWPVTPPETVALLNRTIQRRSKNA